MCASCGVSRSGSVGGVLGGGQEVSSVCTHQGVQDSHFAVHGRSGIQGSNVFHDDSCARLEACLNSRFRRGQEGAGGIKPRCMSIVSRVWRPAEEKLASPQPASGKLHVVGVGRREILSARRLSVGLEKAPRCVVSVLLVFLFLLLCHLGQAVK